MYNKLLLAVVFSVACVGTDSNPLAQQPASLSENQVAGIVRQVNTAEITWLAKHRTYASLHDLTQNKLLGDGKEALNVKDADSATIEDYELRVAVSSDGQHYLASLTPTSSCGIAMFSSEIDVIYRAKALGCQ